MAQQRLTDRTALNEAPANDDLIHIVDTSDTTDNASGTSKKITVQNLISSAIGSIPTEQPIENTYADITALLADQANQTTGFIQKVEDASDDPNVDSGRAYYEKLASTTATLATDYTLISDTQATALDVSDIFTFTVQSVGTSVPANAGGGKIRVQYTALDSKVDFVIFNKQFSFYLDGLVAAQDTYAETVSYSVTFYNTTQSTAVTFKNVDWEDLGAYVKMNAAYSNVDYTNFVADDIVKVTISAHSVGGGSSSVVSDTGTTITFTQDTLYNEASYLTSGNLTLDLTGAVKDTYATVFCSKYFPAISGENYIISSGYESNSGNQLSILSFYYDGTNIYLNIGSGTYLDAPVLTVTGGDLLNNVSWASVSNADSYFVQRATDSGFTTGVTTAYNSTGTSFQDTGLSANTTYYYRAYAVGNGYLNSDWSDTANGIPRDFSTSLVASYSFDSDASDRTGNNDGTEFNTPTYAAAKVSNGISLDGSTQYVTIADSDDFSFTDGAGNDTSFTMSFWLNGDRFSGTQDFIIKRDLSSNNEWQINFSGLSMQWRLFNNGSTAAYIENVINVGTAAGVSTGEWHHYVLTYDGSESDTGMTVYIDNVAYTAGQNTVGTYTGMINGTRPVFIGRRDLTSANYFDCNIDEFHVWKSRVLTTDEIAAIYNTENTGDSIF